MNTAADMSYAVGYRTGSGNQLSLRVLGTLLERTAIPLSEHERIVWCGTCHGTNGGCAEFAPNFSILKPSKPYLYVIEVVLDMAWAIERFISKPNRKRNYNYFCCGFADSITDRYLASLLRPIMDAKFYVVGAGHCKGCSRKRDCTVLKGDVCIHPKRHTFSVEAVGVDCDALCVKLHGHHLGWWYKIDYLPLEMRRFAGVFVKDVDEAMHVQAILSATMAKHKSYMPILPDIPKYERYVVEVPGHSRDAGRQFVAYAGVGASV